MAAPRGTEKQLEDLGELRAAPASPDTAAALRHALQRRSSYVVAKAAALTAEFALAALIPHLADAFPRFLPDGAKRDPGCTAKIALIQALDTLEHSDPDLFLQAMRHIQMEPVWGGRADTAGPLRSAGALALARSAMPALDILTHLVELLVDPEVSVRVDAARAIGHLGTFEAIPPLRLKALLGDTEPEVTGQCLASLLRLDETAAVPFALRFTTNDDNAVRLEALGALALAPGRAAYDAIARLWPDIHDAAARALIVRCLGASPLADAEQFLLDIVIEAPARLAAEAITALAQSRFHASAATALNQILEQRGEPTLTALFQDLWS